MPGYQRPTPGAPGVPQAGYAYPNSPYILTQATNPPQTAGAPNGTWQAPPPGYGQPAPGYAPGAVAQPYHGAPAGAAPAVGVRGYAAVPTGARLVPPPPIPIFPSHPYARGPRDYFMLD